MPAIYKQNIFLFFIFFSAPFLLPQSAAQTSRSFWQSQPASDEADPAQKSFLQSSGACLADCSCARQSCYNSVLLSFQRSADILHFRKISASSPFPAFPSFSYPSPESAPVDSCIPGSAVLPSHLINETQYLPRSFHPHPKPHSLPAPHKWCVPSGKTPARL